MLRINQGVSPYFYENCDYIVYYSGRGKVSINDKNKVKIQKNQFLEISKLRFTIIGC